MGIAFCNSWYFNYTINNSFPRNIPENLQYSQRAEASKYAIDSLDEAIDLLNELYDDEEFDKDDEWIQDAIDKIDDAIWSY